MERCWRESIDKLDVFQVRSRMAMTETLSTWDRFLAYRRQLSQAVALLEDNPGSKE
jgi:hypothetical protein